MKVVGTRAWARASTLALAAALAACSHLTPGVHGDGGPSDGAGQGASGATGSGGASAGTGGTATGGTAGIAAMGGAGGSAGGAGGSTSGVAGGTGTGGAAPPAGDSVLMIHRNPSHDGVYVQPALRRTVISTLAVLAGFKATLPDPNDLVYAQPLFVDGGADGTGNDLLIVATEANNIYALDPTTGGVVWMKNLGTPVPLKTMSCGNIDPFGVTGTPVIDLASRRIFAVAAVLPASGTPTYQIFALSLADGSISPGWPLDVPTIAVSGSTTFQATTQGQRGALALAGGTLYVPFGGLFGDCVPFHGWILGVPIANPTAVKVWTTSVLGGGAWAPGGIASDGDSIYVGTGVTFKTTTWAGGDAVLRFPIGSDLSAPADSFVPTNWLTFLDPTDTGSGAAPVLFSLAGSTPSALAIFFQKDGNAYLLDRTHLGGIGAALGATGVGVTAPYASLHVTSNEIITVPAVYTTTMATYVVVHGNGVGCPNGPGGTLTALKVTPGAPPKLSVAWCAGAGNGAPMVTTSDGARDPIVWLPGAEGSNHLEAYDGDLGTPVTFAGGATTIKGMRRFNSAIAAKGRIYVAADGAVVAFGLP